MNTLELVGADDDVAQSSAVLEDEYSALAVGVLVGVARPATVELLVAHVHRARDNAGSGERHDGPNACGDVQCLACGETGRGADEGEFETHSEGLRIMSDEVEVYKERLELRLLL